MHFYFCFFLNFKNLQSLTTISLPLHQRMASQLLETVRFFTSSYVKAELSSLKIIKRITVAYLLIVFLQFTGK